MFTVFSSNLLFPLCPRQQAGLGLEWQIPVPFGVLFVSPSGERRRSGSCRGQGIHSLAPSPWDHYRLAEYPCSCQVPPFFISSHHSVVCPFYWPRVPHYPSWFPYNLPTPLLLIPLLNSSNYSTLVDHLFLATNLMLIQGLCLDKAEAGVLGSCNGRWSGTQLPGN